ncbi:hypothetical protein IWW47_001700 [Coemansia sp. RSA 2052]|nr:hypothetical protein IWW47_001700 [Coemansia sp. RSA 2052]
MTNFYDYTTSQRNSNDMINSANSGFDEQLQHGWMQAFMAQSSALYHPTAVNSYALAHHQNHNDGGSPHVCRNVQASGELQTQSSDSDSDDISKSLSYLLNQHINQSGAAVSSQYHGRQPSSGFLMPHGNNVGYSTALSSMLEMGYDGGRRVISMPNPLDSLALDLPIHPPPPPSLPPQHEQPVLGIMTSHLMSAKDAAAMGYNVPSSSVSVAVGTPQYSFLGGTGVMQPQPHTPSAAGLANRGIVQPGSSECMSHFLGFSHSGAAFATTPSTSAHQPQSIRGISGIAPLPPLPSMGIAANKSALGITTNKRSAPTSAARSTKRSASGSSEQKSTRARRSRPPLAEAEAALAGSALLEAKLKLRGGTPRDSTFQSPYTAAHSAFATPSMQSALCATPSGMSTPTLTSAASALIPHRVDRQLAEASRPLFFVRPRTSDDQPRRRKRRCVSSGASLSHPTKSDSIDAMRGDAAAAVGDGAASGKGDPEEPNLQWQRISEQRRRDAMRENFDLLKRMLPQGYMASDDGRELARPVLLARFLRWVDDTLIEMESLKGEVAHLRLAQSSAGAVAELWQQQQQQYSSAGGVAVAASPCRRTPPPPPQSSTSESASASVQAPVPVSAAPNTLASH